MTNLLQLIRRWAAQPWLLAVAAFAAALALHLPGAMLSWLPAEGARDWERGFQLLRFRDFTAHGPELFLAGVTPGWFGNLLLGVPHLFGRSMFLGAAFPVVLFAAGAGFMADALRRLHGRAVAALAVAVWVTLPLMMASLRYLWAPSYYFVFPALAFWCAVRALEERSGRPVAWALTAALLGAQVHAGGWVLVGVLLVWSAAVKLLPRERELLVPIAVIVVFLGPWMIAGPAGGWAERGSWREAERNPYLDVWRFRPNQHAALGAAFQVTVQPPLRGYSAGSIPYPFLFSYFEAFHHSWGSRWRLGVVASAASLALPVIMIVGALGGLRRRREEHGARRAVLALAALLAAVTLGIVAFWNPRALVDAEADFPVPLHWFLPLWPAPVVLLAEGIALLWARAFWRRVLLFALVNVLIFNAWILREFHVFAAESREPFQYSQVESWRVHTVEDKEALAVDLARRGLDWESFRARVHTDGILMRENGEGLGFEFRAALESASRNRQPDHAALRYYIFRWPDGARLGGGYEDLQRKQFGGLGLLVYKLVEPAGKVLADPPISVWDE